MALTIGAKLTILKWALAGLLVVGTVGTFAYQHYTITMQDAKIAELTKDVSAKGIRIDELNASIAASIMRLDEALADLDTYRDRIKVIEDSTAKMDRKIRDISMKPLPGGANAGDLEAAVNAVNREMFDTIEEVSK